MGARVLKLSNEAIVGETIYVLGNPLGLTGTISPGIVSALRRTSDRLKLLQITAPVSAGSSGGPVLNSRGEVIGVVVSSMEEGQNLNFAIHSGSIEDLKASLAATKPVNYRSASSVAGSWKIPDVPDILEGGLVPLEEYLDKAPTPKPTPRTESLVDISDVLRGVNDSRTYRFRLDRNVGTTTGDFPYVI